MSKKRNSIYYRDLHNPSLTPILKYKHKSGIRIVVYDKKDPKYGLLKYLVVYDRGHYIGSIDSGWPGDESDITDYLFYLDNILKHFNTTYKGYKGPRRYYLRILRSFPLHPGITYGDFLSKSGYVNWKLVDKYEDEHGFPEEVRFRPIN